MSENPRQMLSYEEFCAARDKDPLLAAQKEAVERQRSLDGQVRRGEGEHAGKSSKRHAEKAKRARRK